MINYLGVLYAILACACWGLSIVMPVFAPGFSATEITLGRYLVYGCLSLLLWGGLLAAKGRFHSAKVWRMAFVFAVTGNVLYYGLEVIGVQMIGPSMVALLFAANPIIVSLYGNFLGKEFPYSLIAAPLLLIASGVLLVHLNDIQIDSDISPKEFIVGAAITLSSISMWAWYAVHNARFLASTSEVKVWEFNILIGVWCFFMALFSAGAFSYTSDLYLFSEGLASAEIYWFIVAIVSLGLFASFFGTLFWHRASSMLPVSLAGQVIVAETTFGLIYTFLLEHRLPYFYELAGFLIVVSGVLISMQRIQKYKAAELVHG